MLNVVIFDEIIGHEGVLDFDAELCAKHKFNE